MVARDGVLMLAKCLAGLFVQFNSILYILFASPLCVIVSRPCVKLKYVNITDSREPPTKVQNVLLAWELPAW